MVLVSKLRRVASSVQQSSASNSFFDKIRTSLTRSSSSTALEPFCPLEDAPDSPPGFKAGNAGMLQDAKLGCAAKADSLERALKGPMKGGFAARADNQKADTDLDLIDDNPIKRFAAKADSLEREGARNPTLAETFEDNTTGTGCDSSSGKRSPFSEGPDAYAFPVDADNIVSLSDLATKPGHRGKRNILEDNRPRNMVSMPDNGKDPVKTISGFRKDGKLAPQMNPSKVDPGTEAEDALEMMLAMDEATCRLTQASKAAAQDVLHYAAKANAGAKESVEASPSISAKPQTSAHGEIPASLWNPGRPPVQVPPAWDMKRDKEVLGPVGQKTRFPSKLPPLSGMGSKSLQRLTGGPPGTSSSPVLTVSHLPASASASSPHE